MYSIVNTLSKCRHSIRLNCQEALWILNYRNCQVDLPYKSFSTVKLLKSPKPASIGSTSYQWSNLKTFHTCTALCQEAEEAVPEEYSFQAETRMLLDIVARSLYSEKEVFLRELISNASDACEKLRFTNLRNDVQMENDLQITITTDKYAKMLTIVDSGIGMTKEEMIKNLGTIARSGSKEFIQEHQKSQGDVQNIIGQFGVGFYSTFMVSNKVEVFSRSVESDIGHCWTSDGSGKYTVKEVPNLNIGTKIVCHLKSDCRQFADDLTIKQTLQKYSSFVGFPVIVNGQKVNTETALWLKNPKDISNDEHKSFYRYLGASDFPRFNFHFHIDVPVNLRCLLYFPETRPGMLDMTKDGESSVSLYSRKILIKSKTTNLVPKWLRFVKGVVDSEDIPLNLSREMLQDSALIKRLSTVVQNKVIRFLADKITKDSENYKQFYTDYGIYLKEGILGSSEQYEKEEIGKLLMYESSHSEPGKFVTFSEYVNRMTPDQKDIYYLAAPSRTLAEASPYFESMKKKNMEVLFCFESYDEIVFMQLRQYLNKNFVSVEKEIRQSKDDVDFTAEGTLGQLEVDNLIEWIKKTLVGKCHSIKITSQLDSHPCIVTVEEMGAARHFLKTQFTHMNDETRYSILKPQLEINPKHPLIVKLSKLKESNPELSELLVDQLFNNAMVTAGLIDDPRTAMKSINELLVLALEKH